MATYNDISETGRFIDQRFCKKNSKNSKFGFQKNASPEHKKVDFEQSIQITGFRMFLGSKQCECSNNITYAGYSGDCLTDLNNFSIKISEPVISRVVIRTNSIGESRERKFTSERQKNAENVFETGLKSNMDAYHYPVSETNNANKLHTLPYLSPPQPNFWRQSKNSQSINMATNQAKKNVVQNLDEGLENIETSSSFTTSSESLSVGNLSDMSSLVLSNMKTGRLSRIASFIKNMWNSTTKGTNKCTEEEEAELRHEAFTTVENKALKLPHKSFNNLNEVFAQNQRQIYQDLNCISLQSISYKKLATMADSVLPSSSWIKSNRNSSSCVQVDKNLKNQDPEYVHKALTECRSDMHDIGAAKLYSTPIPLRNKAVETIMVPSLPKKATINPVDIIIAQNMNAKKEYSEPCVRNQQIMEIEPMNHKRFNGVSHTKNKRSLQVSSEKAPTKSKSIIFCPSPHNLPGNFDETVVSLCDDCYKKTKKSLSDMQANCGPESQIMDGRSEVLSEENFTHTQSNQPHDCKNGNESLADKLQKHVPKKLNIEDLDDLLESVNNHLLGLKPVDENFLKQAMQFLNEKWILVISNKNSMLGEVRNYLKYIQEFSNKLLEMVMYFTDREGNNAFHFACGNERFDIAEELLKYECGYALLTQKNKLGHSPLMICSVSQPRNDQDWSVVKRILELGEVNEASSFSKQTPLMNATSRGCVQMVRLLLEAGADPNLQDSDGSTALMYAAVHGHEACVGFLLEHPKCNTRIKDYDQKTACSVALAAGHKEIALRIYLHSRKRYKDSKIKLVANYQQKHNGQSETNSETHINAISQSQSDHL